MISLPLCFSGATFLIGVLAPLWFGKLLPPVRKIRQGAKWIDPQPVNLPAASQLTVHEVRDYDRCGDKVVVAHHLADWSRELERTIFNTVGIGSAFSLVFMVIFLVSGKPALQAPTTTLTQFYEAILAGWPFSIALAATLVEVYVFVKLVSDQAVKYSQVIEAARPERKSFFAWVGQLFSKRRS